MTLHLTRDELRDITGLKRPDAQMRWLRENGFVALRRADGMPLVSRAHFEAMMGAGTGRKSAERSPNFEALKRGT
jgi:hypothetical protein